MVQLSICAIYWLNVHINNFYALTLKDVHKKVVQKVDEFYLVNLSTLEKAKLRNRGEKGLFQ